MARRDAQISRNRSSRGAAFIVESLILLVFVAASIAVFTQLFSASIATATKATDLTEAAIVAQSAAEEFSSNPEAVAAGQAVGQGYALNGSGDFSVKCEVAQTKTNAGTLYNATISVFKNAEGDAIYELNATRYLSNGSEVE